MRLSRGGHQQCLMCVWVQVCPMGVRLLDGTRQLQHIPLDVGSSIVAGSLADPHVIIRSAEGLVIHLTLRGDPASGCRLAVLRPQLTAVVGGCRWAGFLLSPCSQPRARPT
ncbi:hypothetical protein HPB48_002169 [Haemaphysalis longicornis]|uniref:RSE1/DDB1/CPSF1 second beta-propeller domain-containing protein n=1 Tax=Haemaphysalis longicornis TaxID=44386 RepID=A0A9J6FHA8_HAELO|nr:hypothetical protein HPB48_002169 [Haemaphysalis longicornis]